MILIILFAAFYYFRTTLNGHNRRERSWVWFLLVIYWIAMILYEQYVTNAVGWEYGVPQDDDTGWIFRAATALHQGTPISRLYLLAANSSYDAANRGLSINNLGQYLYCGLVRLALYFPLLFDVRVNLYLLYAAQTLLVFSAGIRLTDALNAEMHREQRQKSYSFFFPFIAFAFCPLIQFNAYKLLRETIYCFCTVQSIVCTMNQQRKGAILYGIVSIVMRPFVIVLLAPVYLCYMWDKEKAVIVNYGMMGTLLLGSKVVTFLVRSLGWAYSIGSVSLQEMIHLFFFPNIINQFQNFLNLSKQPSWVTVLYFLQSVWNVFYIVVFFVGLIVMKKRKTRYAFWLTLFVNSLMLYTIPYDIANMTVRYKFVYLIPMMYFICGSTTKFRLTRKKHYEKRYLNRRLIVKSSWTLE